MYLTGLDKEAFLNLLKSNPASAPTYLLYSVADTLDTVKSSIGTVGETANKQIPEIGKTLKTVRTLGIVTVAILGVYLIGNLIKKRR